MKRFTKWTMIVLLMLTTVQASEDYAFTEEYRLLNDMKLAKKQSSLIVEMRQSLSADTIDREGFQSTQSKFNSVILGLTNGDDSMNLNGTTIPSIRVKLDDVNGVWRESQKTINMALSNGMYRESAIQQLEILANKMSQSISEYNKSYERYKQRSKLSSIVDTHMGSSIEPTLFAFNTIK
ncbi:MAG: hypothetical protein K0U38_07655 [Epsilonproteobacteria bacterium]|nr:hypothetical protein [Campylobacterota bacterium]